MQPATSRVYIPGVRTTHETMLLASKCRSSHDLVPFGVSPLGNGLHASMVPPLMGFDSSLAGKPTIDLSSLQSFKEPRVNSPLSRLTSPLGFCVVSRSFAETKQLNRTLFRTPLGAEREAILMSFSDGFNRFFDRFLRRPSCGNQSLQYSQIFTWVFHRYFHMEKTF